MNETTDFDEAITNAAAPLETRGRVWWAAQAVGTATMVLALVGILRDRGDVRLGGWLTIFLAGALIHDGLVVFLVAAVGTLCSRFLPRALREPVTWFLWVGALVVFVFWPEIAGFGMKADNPSVLPRDYGRNVWIALAIVAAVAVCRGLWAAYRHRLGTSRPE